MKARDVMTESIVTIQENENIINCAKLMANHDIGCLPICNKDEEVIGIITDRDIVLRCIATQKDLNNTTVKEIITDEAICCDADDDIEDVEDLMKSYQIKRIPVIEENKIVGIITIHDLVCNEQIDSEEISDVVEDVFEEGLEDIDDEDDDFDEDEIDDEDEISEDTEEEK